MSGLKNVLGNVYGDPDDRPKKANLDDVKESMDALTEHTDDSEGPTEEHLVAGAADHDTDTPIATSVAEEPLSEAGEWFDDSQEDSPWAMLDELPDLDQDAAPPDEPIATVSGDDEIASEDPTTGTSWLDKVEQDDNSEDWLNDYDDSGWTGSKQDETSATTVDDSGTVDELANFDFASIEDPTDEARVEDLIHGPIDEVETPTAKSDTDLSPTDNYIESADADDLDPGQEAWLDDLFSLDGESEGVAVAEDQTSSAAGDVDAVDPDVGLTEAAAPAIEPPAPSAPIGLDAVAAVYSASDNKLGPELNATLTPTIDPPAGGFYGGWARIDDDILPQKKSGGRRGRRTTEVAIAPDSQQIAQSHSQSIADGISSVSANTSNAPSDRPDLVEANFEEALLGGFTDDDESYANEPNGPEPQSPEAAAAAPEVASFDQPLLQSDEELDPADAVHLFAHDEALEEAATAGGRRKARKAAGKQAKTDKAAQVKAEKQAAKLAKAAADQPASNSDSDDKPVEAAPGLSRKAKAAAAKAARAEKALAKSGAARQAKADAKHTLKGRKGWGSKNRKDNQADEALRSQVDAALAAQVATNTSLSSDDFWTDAAAVPAAEVSPSAPAGMADPLDTELVNPPPAPSEGFDPDPVLD